MQNNVNTGKKEIKNRSTGLTEEKKEFLRDLSGIIKIPIDLSILYDEIKYGTNNTNNIQKSRPTISKDDE